MSPPTVPPGLGRPPPSAATTRRDDRPARRAPSASDRLAPAGTDRAGPHGRRRRGDGQVAVRTRRRRPGRDRADGLPRPGHGVRLQPGRLRHGLPVLRHRPGRVHPPARPRARSSSRWPWPPGRPLPRRLSSVVFMGMGEPLANYDRVWATIRGSMATWASPPGTSRCRRSGVVPGIRRLRRRGPAGQPGRRPSTPPTTRSGTSWCPSTGATPSVNWPRCAPSYVDDQRPASVT